MLRFGIFLGLLLSVNGQFRSQAKQFVVTFMHNGNTASNSGANAIYVTSDQDGSFVVDAPAAAPNPRWYTSLSISAKTTVKVAIPDYLEMSLGTVILRNGILVTSNTSVSVYALSGNIEVSSSEDAFNVVPIKALSTLYFVPTTNSNPAFTVTAVQDGTIVDITLKGSCNITWNGTTYSTGQKISTSLDQLYVFQITSTTTCDLAGTRVMSDKPIAVVSGSSCEYYMDGNSCSHVAEQVLPKELWGKKFIVPSFDNKHITKLRLISAKPSLYTYVTEHYKDGTSRTIKHTLNEDEVMDLLIRPDTLTEIFNSEGLHVTQYGANPFPYALFVPDLDSYGWNYTITNLDHGNSNHYQSYMNIILRADDARMITVNGVKTFIPNLRHVSDLGYAYGSLAIKSGKIYNIQAPHPFMVQVYETSMNGTHAYNAGSQFNHLPSAEVFIQRQPPTISPSTITPMVTSYPNSTTTPMVTSQSSSETTVMTTMVTSQYSPDTTALTPMVTALTSMVTPQASLDTTAIATTSADSCVDVAPKCAALNKSLNLCNEPLAGPKYCKKYCNLCSVTSPTPCFHDNCAPIIG